MAQPTKGHQWQKQADHFQNVINDMNEIVNDPTSTPEEIAEASETIVAMEKNLERLAEKHGVTPTP
jgi:archaellum component FlaG (FlaF/FlaG flagellin family)